MHGLSALLLQLPLRECPDGSPAADHRLELAAISFITCGEGAGGFTTQHTDVVNGFVLGCGMRASLFKVQSYLLCRKQKAHEHWISNLNEVCLQKDYRL